MKVVRRFAQPVNHIVWFSGGKGSWAAAKRVVAEHGVEGVHLVFADTMMEDEDLYRFLHEAAADVLGQLYEASMTWTWGKGRHFVSADGGFFHMLADGRDVWQVFRDRRYLGNSRVDPCSEELKRKLLRGWLEEHFFPWDTRVYLGIDWTEEHRYQKSKPHWQPWDVRAPLCEEPYVLPDRHFADLQAAGIKPPKLYEMGFPHNNCGGFCVKAGISHFIHLREVMPERYAHHASKEQELREFLDKDVAILKDRTAEAMAENDGKPVPLTLVELDRRLTEDPERYKKIGDWGGCGCFSGV